MDEGGKFLKKLSWCCVGGEMVHECFEFSDKALTTSMGTVYVFLLIEELRHKKC